MKKITQRVSYFLAAALFLGTVSSSAADSLDPKVKTAYIPGSLYDKIQLASVSPHRVPEPQPSAAPVEGVESVGVVPVPRRKPDFARRVFIEQNRDLLVEYRAGDLRELIDQLNDNS